MKLLHLLSVVVFSLLQQRGRAARVCCPGLFFCFTDDPPFNDLPLPACAEKQGMVMKVYTRSNPKEGQLITRDSVPSVFNGNLLSMFIVHGFTGSENVSWIHPMKDAAIQQGEYNVIIVGWSKGAIGTNLVDYLQSSSNARAVGAEIALVSNLTIQTRGSSRSRQYCVGHSLGSHVCGHAGRFGQFGRITGLDPAGPLFDTLSLSAGLNPTCADMVDVIHTNGPMLLIFGLGTLRPLGHIDFYPNGGSLQPGCIVDPFDVFRNLAEFFAKVYDSLRMDLEKIACSHRRSCYLFTESILTPCIVSRDVCTDPKDLPDSCKSNGTVLQSLGFHANTFPGRGIFYLKTTSEPSFCSSAVAPLMQRCRLVCFVVSWTLVKFFLNSLVD